MGYFKELPNLQYQNFLSSSLSSHSYITVKNLFRRNKLRDDLQNVFTVFDKYEIMEGARPDTIAEDFYGDSELDWVVLMTAGILNVRNEWPLSNRDLYEYTYDLYGNELNSVHHYETIEIKDSEGKLILPKGKRVDKDFTVSYYDNGNYWTKTGIYNLSTNLNGSIGSVTNWEYETIKNDKKRSIFLLRRMYLQQFLNDMRNIMVYQQSSQRIDDRLARTENTKVTMP
tara:strand:- start:203 stop:886 length:684 start_codon:yes stop_codon:yes gene_type:complete